MSNDKTSKDFELDDLEKPLTEQEMKETIGGFTPVLPGGDSPLQQAGNEVIKTIMAGTGHAAVSSTNGQTSPTNSNADKIHFVPTVMPPVVIPKNPGIPGIPGMSFTPPPGFQQGK